MTPPPPPPWPPSEPEADNSLMVLTSNSGSRLMVALKNLVLVHFQQISEEIIAFERFQKTWA